MSRLGPALTAEQWEPLLRVARNGSLDSRIRVLDRGRVVTAVWQDGDPTNIEVCQSNDPHALAALCLYNQPFGFWPELPKTLRIAAEKLRELTDSPNHWGDLDIAADRIAALLPPEEQP